MLLGFSKVVVPNSLSSHLSLKFKSKQALKLSICSVIKTHRIICWSWRRSWDCGAAGVEASPPPPPPPQAVSTITPKALTNFLKITL